MEPLVSVVMTVYNYQDFVKESIQSILDQSFRDFEFIIIDDASTDSTGEVVNSFKDPRIRYFLNPQNLGQTRSLNKGVRFARGKYIARIDADDIAFAERLKLQVDYLEKNPEVGAVGSWLQSVDEHKKLIRRSRYPLMPNLSRLLLLNLFNWPCLTHPTVTVRKEALEKSGYYNEDYFISQDYDLWLRIARHYTLRNIPVILLDYREHSGSLSRSKREKTRKEVRQIVESNVRFFLPHIDNSDCESLVRVLMFEKQQDPSRGRKALVLLDTLLDSLKEKAESVNTRQTRYLKKMARVFYSPRLCATNPIMALGIFFSAPLFGNRGVLTKRFISAIGHAILR